jgi:23S rRNA (guanosine2251-2'-O)-methyltransferase
MTDKKDDFIFGLRPVIEAIEAGKTIDKVFVQNALQGPIYAELKAILAKNKIRPNYVPVEKLNRFTRKNHQGVVAFISDVPFHKLKILFLNYLKKEKLLFINSGQINRCKKLWSHLQNCRMCRNRCCNYS